MSLGKIIFIVLVVVIIIATAVFGPRFYRVNQMIHLYDEGKISENFINMDKIFDTIPLSASPRTFTFN
jgi:hypothetical protein